MCYLFPPTVFLIKKLFFLYSFSSLLQFGWGWGGGKGDSIPSPPAHYEAPCCHVSNPSNPRNQASLPMSKLPFQNISAESTAKIKTFYNNYELFTLYYKSHIAHKMATTFLRNLKLSQSLSPPPPSIFPSSFPTFPLSTIIPPPLS